MEEESKEEDLSVAGVMLTAPNCRSGHCSCYYCNWNMCCRCGSTQLAHQKVIDYKSRTPPMEREFNKNEKRRRDDPPAEYYTDWINPFPNSKDGTYHTEPVRYEHDSNDEIV